ncbi:class IV adenylate cyclase [Patescibacteria group bacterium]|nr:class IV adenylate cyclase [Patescibacteria group bacterium]
MKEIELLFKIDEEIVKKVRSKLKDLKVNKSREVDVYFYPPDKDFLISENGRENLRVRQSGSKKELTYKKVIYNKGTYSHSIEKNVDVSNIEDLMDILEDVGFRKYITIDKEREIFKDKNFITTIDNVKNLGLFIEIEWAGNDGDEKEIQKLCFKKAQEFGLKTIQDKGYLRLLEEQNNKRSS